MFSEQTKRERSRLCHKMRTWCVADLFPISHGKPEERNSAVMKCLKSHLKLLEAANSMNHDLWLRNAEDEAEHPV